MNRGTGFAPFALGALLWSLAGCSDAAAPMASDGSPVAPVFGKGGGKGGGGDDGGPSAGNVRHRLANALSGSAIQGDGAGDYVAIKKKSELDSEITGDGRSWLRVEEGAAARTVCVSFPAAGPDATILSPGDWADLVSASGGAIDLGATYCDITTMHSSNHGVEDKLLGMDTDPATEALDVQTSGGKLVLKRFDTNGEWQWRLKFDTGRSGGPNDNGLCIRYRPDGTWLLGNDSSIDQGSDAPGTCSGVDDLVDLIRFDQGSPQTGSEFRHVATFRMPFSYELIP